MKTISENKIYGIIRDLCDVVAYHTCITNRRPSAKQTRRAAVTFAILLVIVGVILYNVTGVDYNAGHFCNNYK